MFRIALCCYLVAGGLLVVTSLVTGRRATVATGHPHYLYTRTVVLVERETPTESETDAALDALFAEAEVDTRMTVQEPMFVLGLLDATLPAIAAGGVLIGGWGGIRRYKRNHRRA